MYVFINPQDNQKERQQNVTTRKIFHHILRESLMYTGSGLCNVNLRLVGSDPSFLKSKVAIPDDKFMYRKQLCSPDT